MKILILKPSSLGDVIHALPVLRLLKRHWPDARIRWWLEVRLMPLLKDDPDLDGIHAFRAQTMGRAATLVRNPRQHQSDARAAI